MRKKRAEAEDVKQPSPVTPVQAQRAPTALEILKGRRADKMRQIKRLDREIAQLDHDITYVERYPEHARVLEFISSRFAPGATQESDGYA